MIGSVYQLLQLGDSFFPTGIFSFSQGLERFVQDGLVKDLESLAEFVQDLLEQVAWTDGIALLHAWAAAGQGDLEGLIAIDQEVRAYKLGKESREMTTKTGRQLLRIGAELWPAPLAPVAAAARERLLLPTYPVALGCMTQAAGLQRPEAFGLEMYATASSVCGAALRLMRVDHVQIQRLLLQANRWGEAHYAACQDRALDEMRSAAPLLEIEGMRHEQSYVRIFAN